MSAHDANLVFILGVHRSGTTILYNLLAEFGDFACPTPFHITTFDAFRRQGADHALALRPQLARRFENDAVVDRFIDDIGAGIDTPEEYGFVLPGGILSPDTRSDLDALCRFVAATSDRGGGRRVLLKNPRDFEHMAYVMQAYPYARFIIIHRRPEQVLASRGRELRDLFARRSAYQAIIEPLYARLAASPIVFRAIGLATRMDPLFGMYLARHQARELNAYLAADDAGLAASCIELRYEDLIAEPGAQVNRVLSFLGLPEVAADAVAGRLRAPRTPTDIAPPGSWILRRLARGYYERWGYPLSSRAQGGQALAGGDAADDEARV